jgi:hypothetical protein
MRTISCPRSRMVSARPTHPPTRAGAASARGTTAFSHPSEISRPRRRQRRICAGLQREIVRPKYATRQRTMAAPQFCTTDRPPPSHTTLIVSRSAQLHHLRPQACRRIPSKQDPAILMACTPKIPWHARLAWRPRRQRSSRTDQCRCNDQRILTPCILRVAWMMNRRQNQCRLFFLRSRLPCPWGSRV